LVSEVVSLDRGEAALGPRPSRRAEGPARDPSIAPRSCSRRLRDIAATRDAVNTPARAGVADRDYHARVGHRECGAIARCPRSRV
jgi:hypothetical protein